MQENKGTKEDCLGCRLTGGFAALGLSGYTFYELLNVRSQPVSSSQLQGDRLLKQAELKAIRSVRFHKALLASMSGC